MSEHITEPSRVEVGYEALIEYFANCKAPPGWTPESSPGPVLIRESRIPVEIVLHFQAFAISSEGDLLQSKGRNEWTLVDLSEPSEALTHDIIQALKLCPMLPTVFSLVTAENVQALFRAFAAGFNHAGGKKSQGMTKPARYVTTLEMREAVAAAVKPSGPESTLPIQPEGREGMTWTGVVQGLHRAMDRPEEALHMSPSTIQAIRNAAELIMANHKVVFTISDGREIRHG